MTKDIEAFIVRIWQEAEAIKGGGNVWRGSIVHVGSNRQLYFYNLESIARFIRENTIDQGLGTPHENQRPFNNSMPTLLNRIYESIYAFGTRIWRQLSG